MKKRLLILSTDKYPQGDAGAVRTHMLAKLFSELSYEVTIVALGNSTLYSFKEYDGIRYISLRSEKNNIFFKISNLLFYLRNLKRYLFLPGTEYDAFLIVHSIPLNAFSYIKKVGRKKTLLYDCVEWFSPQQFKFRNWNYTFWKNNKMNTEWIDTSFKVISISSYLHENFLKRNIESIRIPAILDVKGAERIDKEVNSHRIKVVYAGSPGKKDYLKEVLEGFSLLPEDKREVFEIKIIGITEKQLRDICDVPENVINNLKTIMKCFGRITREEVIKILQNADFTVLLRNPELRYAKAGFPTKVAESMTYGVPVICNYSSDLSRYIYDMKNGIVVEKCTSQSFYESLQRVCLIDEKKIKDIKSNARYTAERFFDYRNYIEPMREFLK